MTLLEALRAAEAQVYCRCKEVNGTCSREQLANELRAARERLERWLASSDNASIAVAQAINEPHDEEERRAYYEKLNAAKTCKGWCSTYDWPEFKVDVLPPLVYFTAEGFRAAFRRGYCTPACRDAERSLHVARPVAP